MKKALFIIVIALLVIVCPLLIIFARTPLDGVQIDTLKVVSIICGVSVLYCFVVGEITNNNSQMDKLWSILPEVYIWVVAVKGGMSLRLIIMAVIATLWGARLTYNFGRKGAYKLKFWEGEEDYRWVLLRNSKKFQPKWKWSIFNFFFISLYQNVLILLTTMPALMAMSSTKPFGVVDIIATVLMLGSVIYETIADEQQWKFQTRKWGMLKSGKTLEELPHPYNKGFNTVGLWNVSRHPNYLGEQATWISLYIFTIGAGLNILNWSLVGAVLLVLLFMGSSTLAEKISASKYPEYINYCNKVSRFFPWKKYNV